MGVRQMNSSSTRFVPKLFASEPNTETNSVRRNIIKAAGFGLGALSAPALVRAGAVMSRSRSANGPLRPGQITVVYDAFGKTSSLIKDWGFSAFIEYGGKRVLFDTGNNAEIFAHNVEARGIDLSNLDFVVVSHRHGDHTSGLNHLLKVNSRVPIYTPKENFGVFGATLPGSFLKRNKSLPPEMRYFDGQPPDTMRFGTPWPQGNFKWVSRNAEVAPGFHLILLKGSWGVDLEVMEVSLAIDTPDGTVLVVGCGHPTIEKVAETAKATTGKPIHLVIGGLHLIPATDGQIQYIATALHDTWKVAWIAPVHCTGEPAFAIVKQIFADRYVYAGLGTTIALGATVASVAEAGQPTICAMDDEDLRTYAAGVAVASECCIGCCQNGFGPHVHRSATA